MGLSAWERAEVCHKIADLILERRDEFARELSSSRGSRSRPRRFRTSTRRPRTSGLPLRT